MPAAPPPHKPQPSAPPHSPVEQPRARHLLEPLRRRLKQRPGLLAPQRGLHRARAGVVPPRQRVGAGVGLQAGDLAEEGGKIDEPVVDLDDVTRGGDGLAGGEGGLLLLCGVGRRGGGVGWG
jgi:hypothetical protein